MLAVGTYASAVQSGLTAPAPGVVYEHGNMFSTQRVQKRIEVQLTTGLLLNCDSDVTPGNWLPASPSS